MRKVKWSDLLTDMERAEIKSAAVLIDAAGEALRGVVGAYRAKLEAQDMLDPSWEEEEKRPAGSVDALDAGAMLEEIEEASDWCTDCQLSDLFSRYEVK